MKIIYNDGEIEKEEEVEDSLLAKRIFELQREGKDILEIFDS